MIVISGRAGLAVHMAEEGLDLLVSHWTSETRKVPRSIALDLLARDPFVSLLENDEVTVGALRNALKAKRREQCLLYTLLMALDAGLSMELRQRAVAEADKLVLRKYFGGYGWEAAVGYLCSRPLPRQASLPSVEWSPRVNKILVELMTIQPAVRFAVAAWDFVTAGVDADAAGKARSLLLADGWFLRSARAVMARDPHLLDEGQVLPNGPETSMLLNLWKERLNAVAPEGSKARKRPNRHRGFVVRLDRRRRVAELRCSTGELVLLPSSVFPSNAEFGGLSLGRPFEFSFRGGSRLDSETSIVDEPVTSLSRRR